MSTDRAGAWLLPLQADAPVRVVAFPYAGGGLALYRRWAAQTAGALQLYGAQLPGREERFPEPAATRMREIVPPIVDAIAGLDDQRPFAFFGHSLGALIAFEVTRALRRRGARLPVHLFVSARAAPHRQSRWKPLHELPEATFLSELRRLEGTPPAVLENDELMALLSPTIRADFAVYETYEYVEDAPLDVPISAFGGRADPEADEDELAAWQEQTQHFHGVRLFPGEHFYLHDQGAAIVQAMREAISEGRPGR